MSKCVASVSACTSPTFAAAPDCWTREYVSVKWEGVLEMDALRYAGLLNESAIMPAASDKRWLPAATATTYGVCVYVYVYIICDA